MKWEFLLATIAVVWISGLAWFALSLVIDSYRKPDLRRTQAIVVLTGGSRRIRTGLELLSQEYGKRLLISGVHRTVRIETILKNENFGTLLKPKIDLDYTSRNTRENALQTWKWIQNHDYTSLRLVTSHAHMYRSLIEFKRIIPASIQIIPHRVIPESNPQSSQVQKIVVEYNKLFFTFWYSLIKQGWTVLKRFFIVVIEKIL